MRGPITVAAFVPAPTTSVVTASRSCRRKAGLSNTEASTIARLAAEHFCPA